MAQGACACSDGPGKGLRLPLRKQIWPREDCEACDAMYGPRSLRVLRWTQEGPAVAFWNIIQHWTLAKPAYALHIQGSLRMLRWTRDGLSVATSKELRICLDEHSPHGFLLFWEAVMAKRRRKRCAGVSVGMSKALAKVWFRVRASGPRSTALNPDAPLPLID